MGRRRQGRNTSGRFIAKGGKSDTSVSEKVSPSEEGICYFCKEYKFSL